MAGKSSVKRSGISGTVKALIEKAVTDAGYELWDVDYVKEGTDYNLVITIDKKPLVTISDCEKVTRLIDPILDEADPIPDSYYLEVSSAGSERDLKRPEHFECYKGKKIKIGLSFRTEAIARQGKLLGNCEESINGRQCKKINR